MKLSINSSELKKLLVACVATAAKAEMPVLSALKLEAKNGTLYCTGYDLSLSVVTKTTDVNIEKDGVAIVTSNILKKINDFSYGEITMETTKKLLTISSENGIFNIPLFLEEEYPSLPKKETDSTKVEFNIDDFVYAVNAVAYATETDVNRNKIHGISVMIENGFMTIVGIDGHKLAVRKIPARTTETLGFRLELDKVQRAIKAIPDEGKAKIDVYTRHLELSFEDVSITIRLVDGCVSNYNDYIPRDSKTIVKVNREALIEGCRKCQIVNTADRIRFPLKAEVSNAYGEIRLSLSSNTGSCDARVSGVVNGDNLIIGLDNEFLLNALLSSKIKDADADDVVISFNGPLAPITIKVDGHTDEMVNLIVPMRLSKDN